MNLLRRFPLLAFALVLISIVGLCIAQESIGLLLVAGTLAAISWYVTEGPRGKVLPRWVSSLLLIAVSLNVFVQLVLQDDEQWLQVLGRFGVWMTLIKLYELKTPRDYRLLLSLSLLLMLTGAVQSASLLFGAVLLVYAVLGLFAVLLFQLYAANENARTHRKRTSPVGAKFMPAVKTAVGHRVPGQFYGLAAGIAGVGFTLSVLVFVIFPRNFGEGTVGIAGSLNRMSRAGFTDAVDLVSGSRISDSHRSVMALQLIDDDDKPLRLDEPLLLRGAVLDEYMGNGRFGATESVMRPIETNPPAMVALAADIGIETGGFRQVVEPLRRQTVLFAMGTATEVTSPDAEPLRYDPVTGVITRSDASLDSYTVRSVRRPTDQLLDLLAGEYERSPRFDALDNPSIGVLARDLLARASVPTAGPGDAGSPQRGAWNMQAARVFQSHLQSDRFVYDLDLSDVIADADIDPIEQFLFQTRRGHCEYFAAAMVALCHNVRIPVRMVTGYVAWQYDDAAEEYKVLESNAHAWTEIREGPRHWVAVDPTPAATLRGLHDAPVTLADRLSWIYQRFETTWDAGVTTYDSASQNRLAGRFDFGWADRMAGTVQTTRDWMVQINRAFYFGPAGYIWMGVVAFALVLAVLVLIRLMRRTRAIRQASAIGHIRGAELHRLLRSLGFYLDMLVVLEHCGIGKPAYRPPMEHAERLEATHPESAAIVHHLADLFYRVRFAQQPLKRDDASEARRLVEQLRLLRGKS